MIKQFRHKGLTITKPAEALNISRKAGSVNPGLEVALDLGETLDNRGKAKLNFRPEQEFKDPFGIQDKLLSEHAKGL